MPRARDGPAPARCAPHYSSLERLVMQGWFRVQLMLHSKGNVEQWWGVFGIIGIYIDIQPAEYSAYWPNKLVFG